LNHSRLIVALVCILVVLVGYCLLAGCNNTSAHGAPLAVPDNAPTASNEPPDESQTQPVPAEPGETIEPEEEPQPRGPVDRYNAAALNTSAADAAAILDQLATGVIRIEGIGRDNALARLKFIQARRSK
jgi:hypothetical protein